MNTEADVTDEEKKRRFAFLGMSIDLVSLAECYAGARMFMGRPDRWHEKPGPLWRCPNDHVSEAFLKSEVGGDLCLAAGCDYQPVRLTFPEDHDGPFQHPVVKTCGARSILGGRCVRPEGHLLFGYKHTDPGYHEEWTDE